MATTSTPSASSLWILAQRAIWFRFDPIRASSQVRSRCSLAYATVQVRTRPTDRRTRSESDNPNRRGPDKTGPGLRSAASDER